MVAIVVPVLAGFVQGLVMAAAFPAFFLALGSGRGRRAWGVIAAGLLVLVAMAILARLDSTGGDAASDWTKAQGRAFASSCFGTCVVAFVVLWRRGYLRRVRAWLAGGRGGAR